MTLQGAPLLPQIKMELARCLEEDGFSGVAEAVGADHAK
jgi:dihydroorotate dehydrogenase